MFFLQFLIMLFVLCVHSWISGLEIGLRVVLINSVAYGKFI